MTNEKKVNLLVDVLRFEDAVKCGVHNNKYWECKRYWSAKLQLTRAGEKYADILKAAKNAKAKVWDMDRAIDGRGMCAFIVSTEVIKALVFGDAVNVDALIKAVID